MKPVYIALIPLVSAHGYVQQIGFGTNLVDTWNPYKDPQKNPPVNKITRIFKDNGPVTDGLFTTDAITCNIGRDGKNNVPVSAAASVAAGSTVKFMWTDWQSDHPGPILTYLADCKGKCSSFSGSTGNVWVKIDQAGYDASKAVPWASKRLPTQNSTWTVNLPSSIKPGEYVLRHEILGLQRTNKNGSLAQFYPGCHQITVTGTGTTALPVGIALPGAYQPNDKKSIFLEYRDVSASNPYTPPGGPVWGDKGWSS
ncbi:lytic polysaccharide monooxygenase [Cucurbitaria berberidis CBS 394.84]|uniref:lytic cellulose monooxygenase (C4-dehydrogenating) n=1 Tax=Cucurbitaria berberidis CBS 394.84 TaxID=1168544 RepID=A0A9P4GKS4_9PLEO|nr:lytic polysaccharide monooxygenase [Cucurbitaria berberidis CBS 394.84]KAF1848148.1 lytic polysaccharide monooxygenase [Cucurbitaria berberidis CBS 394.84]